MSKGPMHVPDPEEAKRLTEEAIEQSGQSPTEDWLAAAEETTMWVATRTDPFSTNDVWPWLEVPPNRRSLGYAFRRLQSKGLIERTGNKVTSAFGHGQLVSEWTKR